MCFQYSGPHWQKLVLNSQFIIINKLLFVHPTSKQFRFVLQFSSCFPLFRTQEKIKMFFLDNIKTKQNSNEHKTNEELQIAKKKKKTTEFFIIKCIFHRLECGCVGWWVVCYLSLFMLNAQNQREKVNMEEKLL